MEQWGSLQGALGSSLISLHSWKAANSLFRPSNMVFSPLSQNTNNFMPFLLFSKRNKQRHFSKSGQSTKSLTETLNYTPFGITYIDMLASYWKADYFACLVFYSGMMLYIFTDETILPSSISQTPRSETLLLLCIDGVLLRLLFNIVVTLKLDDISVSNLL
jgi:hypothetical protein